MNNETQWTKGPWATLDDGYQYKITAHGVELAGCNTAGDVDDATNAANARLIAAAPEMAALLEDIADQLDRADTDEECGKAANDIEPKVCALLAKIKGAQ